MGQNGSDLFPSLDIDGCFQATDLQARLAIEEIDTKDIGTKDCRPLKSAVCATNATDALKHLGPRGTWWNLQAPLERAFHLPVLMN
jgi:hypothetical protein